MSRRHHRYAARWNSTRSSISKGLLRVNRAEAKAILVLLWGLLWPPSANAHPEFSQTTVNRYLKVSLVSPTQFRLAYTVLYGAAPAAAARKLADHDGDGRLEDREIGALGEQIRKEVAAGLDVRVEGTRVSLAFEPVTVGLPVRAVSPEPFSVDLVAFVPLAGLGPHVVRVDDTTPLPQLGETEIRIEEGPTTQLLTSHRGDSGSERELRFVFTGPKWSLLEDRSVTMQFVASDPPPKPRRSWTRVGALLVVLSGLLGTLAYRYRNMKG